MSKINIPPKLREELTKKWHDLTFVAASFRRSGLLGPNTSKDITSLIRHFKKQSEVKINKKKGVSRKV